MLSWLQTTNVLVGLIIALFGAISGVVVFVHRRMRAIATDVAREGGTAQAETTARLDLIDGDMSRLRAQVGKVSEDLGKLSERVVGVERTMETVARSADVAALRTDLAEFKGATVAKLDGVAGLLDTLYQAALRSGPSSRSE
jgi:hypothetical protein